MASIWSRRCSRIIRPDTSGEAPRCRAGVSGRVRARAGSSAPRRRGVVPRSSSRPRARFEVRFDELTFQEDLGRATARGREVATEAREPLEREGPPPRSYFAARRSTAKGQSYPTASRSTCPRLTASGASCSNSCASAEAAGCCSPTSRSPNAIPIRLASLTSTGARFPRPDGWRRHPRAVPESSSVLKRLPPTARPPPGIR